MNAITKVTVTTAIKLSDKQAKLIVTTLEKKLDSTINLQQIVDTEVVGGIRLTVGSTQIDATIRHKLDVLKSQLLNI